MSFPDLKIKVFADGANKNDMLKRYREGFVKGFTTNPTLMKKAGVSNYEAFAKEILGEIKDLPISFEVFADDFEEMEKQALQIKSWGSNVNVKIPISNTKRESSLGLIKRLLDQDIALNVTALFTEEQIKGLADTVQPKDDVIVSIFAGRIADAGVDPMPIMRNSVKWFESKTNSKILWASPREVLNVYQAEECGCHIITATDSIISKLPLKGKDLGEFSLDTVKLFYKDATEAGYSI